MMGVETLDVEDGVEKGLVKDMYQNRPHTSVLQFSFYDPSKSFPLSFLLPANTEELVSFLFDKSMNKTIDHAYRIIAELKETGEHYLIGYRFYTIESKDGQTNITPEFLETIYKYGRMLKK